MPKYLPYLTTQRCSRPNCQLTVRLITPIEHCSRCNSPMEIVEAPERDFDALIATATDDVINGFEDLLRERRPPIDFRIRLEPSSAERCRNCPPA